MVKIIDFCKDKIKLNLARANPKESRTQGRAKFEIILRDIH